MLNIQCKVSQTCFSDVKVFCLIPLVKSVTHKSAMLFDFSVVVVGMKNGDEEKKMS